jgi:hypothetical protein
MSKAEEFEALGLALATPLSAFDRISPELNEARLSGV